jgi:PIN domain nuclease of toxin-antitoxin system
MTYLLDTNVFIFLITKDLSRLSIRQKQILSDKDNDFVVSEASFYEIGIKARLEKPDFIHVNISTIEQDREENQIAILKSKIDYYLNIPNVPKVIMSGSKLHGDPFDLLIISQALHENLSVLSTDSLFPLYEGLDVIS